MPRRERRGWYDVGHCACGRQVVVGVGEPLVCVSCSAAPTPSWLRRLINFFTRTR